MQQQSGVWGVFPGDRRNQVSRVSDVVIPGRPPFGSTAVRGGVLGYFPPTTGQSSVLQSDHPEDFRRQQARFHQTLFDIDRQNSWMAVPALAPLAPLFADGLIGEQSVLAARAATQTLRNHPFDFPERDPYRQVGDNWFARIGRRAHQHLEAKVKAKGWSSSPAITGESGATVKPDVVTPREFNMELKPNTPSDQRAAARAVRRYRSETGKRTRAIFYNPDDYK